MFDYANGITNGGEMTLMVALQMFDIPFAVITPNYIWATHDINVINIPVVFINKLNNRGHATCE